MPSREEGEIIEEGELTMTSRTRPGEEPDDGASSGETREDPTETRRFRKPEEGSVLSDTDPPPDDDDDMTVPRRCGTGRTALKTSGDLDGESGRGDDSSSTGRRSSVSTRDDIGGDAMCCVVGFSFSDVVEGRGD